MIDPELDFLRRKMVNEQLIARGIKDTAILKAFLNIDRHLFVTPQYQNNAYSDYPLPLSGGQTISQPYITALMLQSLELKPEDRVLEIGTGSGYAAAVLAGMVKEVYSVERIESLAQKAKKILALLKYENIKLDIRDGTLGWPEYSPYDAIVVSAASFKIPNEVGKQLKAGGRLVMPIGNFYSQTLTVFTKQSKGFSKQELCGVSFVPLVGFDGLKKKD